jgi:hypothetical protein
VPNHSCEGNIKMDLKSKLCRLFKSGPDSFQVLEDDDLFLSDKRLLACREGPCFFVVYAVLINKTLDLKLRIHGNNRRIQCCIANGNAQTEWETHKCIVCCY